MTRHPKLKRGKNGQILVERFSLPRRLEHALALLTVTTLFLTGLPQILDGKVGATMLRLFGGLDAARHIHRVAGLVLCVHAAAHITANFIGVVTGRMRLALLPTTEDVKDARDTLLYYFGFRSEGPRLPKFDYRQKFEYLGMVFGGLAMVASGLVLLYPQATASLLPGEIIPAARVLHTNEAVLAFLVLIIWHVYGSHLSPEVFPIDKSIFTGYITLEDLKRQHAREYEHLFPHGAPVLPGEKAPAPSPAPPPAAASQSPGLPPGSETGTDGMNRSA